MSIRNLPLSRRATVGAVAALALSGCLAACGSSQTTTTTATPAATNASASQGAPPAGMGTEVTGTAAAKAKAAALAKYPGTVEHVLQLSDGSYVVHVLRSSGGEVHVKVSKAFAVTGLEQGMPGGGTPPSGYGGTPPSGSATTSAA